MKAILAGSNQSSDNCQKFEWSNFTTRPALKAIMIGLVLVNLNVNNGVPTIMTYITYLFKDIGSSLSPNELGIIASTIQLIGVCIAAKFVDRLGRRVSKIYLISIVLLSLFVHLNQLRSFIVSFSF